MFSADLARWVGFGWLARVGGSGQKNIRSMEESWSTLFVVCKWIQEPSKKLLHPQNQSTYSLGGRSNMIKPRQSGYSSWKIMVDWDRRSETPWCWANRTNRYIDQSPSSPEFITSFHMSFAPTWSYKVDYSCIEIHIYIYIHTYFISQYWCASSVNSWTLRKINMIAVEYFSDWKYHCWLVQVAMVASNHGNKLEHDQVPCSCLWLG